MPSIDAAGWALLSRIGEAQLLLPAMAAACLWLARAPQCRPFAGAWLGATALAAVVTTVTKVAFIGWEVGYPPLDFTGLSGHSMFSAAVLPVLARIVAGPARRRWARAAVVAGFALAVLVAVSRVVIHAHSPSESAFGFLAGSLASAWALRRATVPTTPPPRWLALAVLAWLMALPFVAPRSRTHDWVTALSLELSGREHPYTRHAMHRRAGQQRRASGQAWLADPVADVQGDPVRQRQFGGDGVGTGMLGDLQPGAQRVAGIEPSAAQRPVVVVGIGHDRGDGVGTGCTRAAALQPLEQALEHLRSPRDGDVAPMDRHGRQTAAA